MEKLILDRSISTRKTKELSLDIRRKLNVHETFRRCLIYFQYPRVKAYRIYFRVFYCWLWESIKPQDLTIIPLHPHLASISDLLGWTGPMWKKLALKILFYHPCVTLRQFSVFLPSTNKVFSMENFQNYLTLEKYEFFRTRCKQ